MHYALHQCVIIHAGCAEPFHENATVPAKSKSLFSLVNPSGWVSGCNSDPRRMADDERRGAPRPGTFAEFSLGSFNNDPEIPALLDATAANSDRECGPLRRNCACPL
jgi:hypothetical protein